MSEVKDFIFDILRENKRGIIIIILVSTFGSLLAATIPYIYGRLFDLAIIPDSATSILLSLVVLWFGLSLISNYTSNKTGAMGEVLGIKIALKSETNSYSHFITLPILYHKKRRRGEILHKISRASWNLQRIVEVFSQTLPQFLVLIFSLIAMLWIRWELALIIVLSFVVYALITINKTKNLMKIHEKEDKMFEKQFGKVYDKLYNVFLVKNFAMEKEENKNIKNHLVNRLTPIAKYSINKSTELSIIQDIIYSISLVSVLSLAILFLRIGTISPGEFVMFFGYTNLAFTPFKTITGVYRNFKRSTVSVKRLINLKKIIPEEMKHGDKIINNFRGEVEFENVSFKYSKGNEVLRNIDLKIKAGETIALVGKSGVGKTTLTELMLGYYKTNRGKIKFKDTEISKLKLSWIRDQIAIVPQDLNLFNDTLWNNIRYANPKATKKEIMESSKSCFSP